jgi:hypothetical protein
VSGLINLTSYDLLQRVYYSPPRNTPYNFSKPSKIENGEKMNKLELMKEFMNTFVGNGFHLVIRDGGNGFLVHTIEIMQKVDENCPVKDIPVGDYFLHLKATDVCGEEASIVCNWSEELLRNLLENQKIAKEAGQTHIVMFRNPMTKDPNNWMLTWGNHEQTRPPQPKVTYIS